MKKSKLIIGLAVSMLLASCTTPNSESTSSGSTSEPESSSSSSSSESQSSSTSESSSGSESSSESSSSASETTSITLSADIPTEIELGSTVDIASYINVEPAGGSYHLRVKSTTVAVLNSEVTGVALGAFEISIEADNGDASATYTGTIISNEQAQIVSLLTNAKKNYYVVAQVYALNDYDYYEFATLTYAYHNENYFCLPSPYWTGDESSSYSDLSGLVNINGSGHSFTYYTSLETPTLEISPAKELDSSYYTMGAALPTEGFSDVISSDGRLSYVQVDDDVAESLVTSATGFSLATLMNAYYPGYSYGSQISYDEANDGLLLSVTSGGTTRLRFYLLRLGSNDLGLSLLDEYLASGEEPTPLSFDDFANTIKNIRDNNLSYTTDASIKIGYYLNSAWVDATTEMSYSSGGTSTVLDSVANSWGLEPSSYTAYNDSEMKYSINNVSGQTQGYLPHNGTFYRVTGTPNGETMSYSQARIGSAEDYNISTPITSGSVLSRTTIYNNFSYVTDEALVGNYSSVKASTTGTTATHINHGDEGALLLMFLNAFPQIGHTLARLVQNISSSTNPDLGWYEFMDDLTITYDSGANSITMEGSISTIDYALIGEYGYSVNAIWSITISDIGSTTVPTDWINDAFNS